VSLDEIEERGAILYAEKQDEPNTHAEVFYNPEMRTNRDLSVAAAKVYFDEDVAVLDATAASGVRGFRYSGVAEELVLNDTSDSSVDAIRRGLDANNLDAEVVQRDARRLLADRQYEFDLVDVDPYGSFLPFLDPAATAVRREGLIGLTATDLAGPAGSYPKVGRRRYGSVPLKNEFMHETGLRIYVKEVYRAFARHNRSFKPLLCFHQGHYSRVMGSVYDSKQGANRNLDNIGYLSFCPECRWRRLERAEECRNCGSSVRNAGPLWTGRISDSRLTSDMAGRIPESWNESKELVDRLEAEADIPTPFYDLHELASAADTQCPPIDDFVGELRETGYPATRSHFSHTGVKTTAPIDQLHDLCREV
jgi:N2,N2-dimethylguanosine tRNA methyltransferase